MYKVYCCKSCINRFTEKIAADLNINSINPKTIVETLENFATRMMTGCKHNLITTNPITTLVQRSQQVHF